MLTGRTPILCPHGRSGLSKLAHAGVTGFKNNACGQNERIGKPPLMTEAATTKIFLMAPTYLNYKKTTFNPVCFAATFFEHSNLSEFKLGLGNAKFVLLLICHFTCSGKEREIGFSFV